MSKQTVSAAGEAMPASAEGLKTRRAALSSIAGAGALIASGAAVVALPAVAAARAGETSAAPLGAADDALTALAGRFVRSARLVDDLTERLCSVEDAIEYPQRPSAIIRRQDDWRFLHSAPNRVGEPYADDSWLDAVKANAARLRQGGSIGHQSSKDYCARVEEIAAAMSGWKASRAAAYEASGAPALQTDVLAAAAARDALEGRLASTPAVTLQGVFVKFAAVAEAMGDEALEEDPEDLAGPTDGEGDEAADSSYFDEIEFRFGPLLRAAIRDYARLTRPVSRALERAPTSA